MVILEILLEIYSKFTRNLLEIYSKFCNLYSKLQPTILFFKIVFQKREKKMDEKD